MPHDWYSYELDDCRCRRNVHVENLLELLLWDISSVFVALHDDEEIGMQQAAVRAEPKSFRECMSIDVKEQHQLTKNIFLFHLPLCSVPKLSLQSLSKKKKSSE